MSILVDALYQPVQILGSLLVLMAFIGAAAGLVKPSTWAYLMLNAVGSTVLALTATVKLEWGFILLEGTWALVSIVSMCRKGWHKRAATPR